MAAAEKKFISGIILGLFIPAGLLAVVYAVPMLYFGFALAKQGNEARKGIRSYNYRA